MEPLFHFVPGLLNVHDSLRFFVYLCMDMYGRVALCGPLF